MTLSTTLFRRPPRLAAPVVPENEVLLAPPPELTRTTMSNVWLTALPALSGLGSVAYLMAGPPSPITYVAGSFFLFSSLAMIGGSVLGARSGEKVNVRQSRRDYLRYLDRMRVQVRHTAAVQRQALQWQAPDPTQLWTVLAAGRMWERRGTDPDFGVVRIALGARYLATPLKPSESAPVEDLDALCALALKRFITTHSVVPDLPVQVSLRRFAAVSINGDRAEARALARSIVIQAATFHTPADLRVLICTQRPDEPAWSWAKWLPHAHHPTEIDRAGPLRMIDPSMAVLERWLGTELVTRPRFNRRAEPDTDLPHLLVIVDGGLVHGTETLLDPDGLAAVTVIDLDGRAQELAVAHGIELVIDGGALSVRSGSRLDALGAADAPPVELAETLARQLAGFRVDTVTTHPDDLSTVDQTLPGLLGVTDPGALELSTLWRARPTRDRLRVPIAISADGTVLELDIKEAAQNGMGPHGLVIGATGSGKSELLRTLVLALAATHPPEALNLVLVDFKGGVTFAEMQRLPHVAAVISNLERDLTMVDRMQEALAGELNRRQEILRAAGNLVSARDYERVRARGAVLPPMPDLFVVVDEFSELLAQKPEFVELFAQIGRLGRALGLHLLLASQRLDEGRLRGLEAHLSYRICLRTFSPQDSRTVIGVPDAHELPHAPGHGYLQSDTATLKRFRAAYVSGPYHSGERVDAQILTGAADIRPFPAGLLGLPVPSESIVDEKPTVSGEEQQDDDAPTLLSVIVGQLAGRGGAAHQIWLPPLEEPDTLDVLMPSLRIRDGRGFGADPAAPPLQVPVGTVDRPFHQRRDPLVVDVSGSGGHVAVVGGPNAGKSTMLRSLMAALALRHTSAEVQFYCMDFSGTLFGLAALPHVGAVAGRKDAELVRRIVAEVGAVIEHRELRFRELGVDSMDSYRGMRTGLPAAEDHFGDVFLVVDGWSVLRQDYEDLENQLVNLASRSLTYGVHLVVTATRWLDLRLGIRELIGTKLELKLGDPLDSAVDRKAQQQVPAGRPGRGVSPTRQQFLAAVPRVDGRRGANDLSDGVADLVRRVATSWSGPAAPRVRLLPTVLDYDELHPAARERGVVVGLEGLRLEPVVLNPRQDNGLVLIGDTRTGKTSTLRSIGRQVVENWQPARAKLVVFDYKRTMLGEFSGESLLGYAATAQQAVDVVAGLVKGFTRRLPPADVTPEQLRNRDWWTGPDIYILVDDYDRVATASNPLLPLLELLPSAPDIGMNLIIVRRAGGAGRAMHDPVINAMRELGFPAIVGSVPRDEGLLFGVPARTQPPGRATLVDRAHGVVPIQLVRLDPEV